MQVLILQGCLHKQMTVQSASDLLRLSMLGIYMCEPIAGMETYGDGAPCSCQNESNKPYDLICKTLLLSQNNLSLFFVTDFYIFSIKFPSYHDTSNW